jgi:class 3 adenylate cyclase
MADMTEDDDAIVAGRPSGTVTFLFTDVEGSTRLWATDKDAMSASLLVHDAILRGAIEGSGGYVFTTAGDSFAAAFGRASDAVRAATESQRALTDAVWPGPALKVRMGLHLGEAEERGGDYFGPVVNTAARVEAAGHGGQVLITEPVRIAAGATEVSPQRSDERRPTSPSSTPTSTDASPSNRFFWPHTPLTTQAPGPLPTN